MGGKTRATIALFGALATAAALMFVVPAFGSTPEDAVRLHLGTDAQRFVYHAPGGDIVQPVAVGNKGCAVKTELLTGPLVSLDSNAGTKVGLVDLGIGVKSGGSNGTPCSQIDSREKLVINNTYSRLWRALRLDLELKGNARTLVTLTRTNSGQSQTHILLTGSSIEGSGETPLPGFPYTAFTTSADPQAACANPSDSGPDSGGNDNCLWSIASDFDFDLVEITTSVGTVSLEGSEDFENSPDHDSLFFFNSAPTANNTTFDMDEDDSLPILPSQVGTDPEGDALVIDVLTAPTQGTVTENVDGTVKYEPDPNFFGTDSFTFQVCEADNPTACSTNTATITVNVENVNDAPVASDDSYQTDERSDTRTEVTLSETAPGVLDNDSDIDGPALFVSAVAGSAVNVGNAVILDDGLGSTLGTLTVQSDGSFTYTPDLGYPWANDEFVRVDTWQYTVSDGDLTDTATVSITVYRVVCTGEIVSDTDGDVSGSFTLITSEVPCKRYMVDAEDGGTGASETVTFDSSGTGAAEFRGFLSFEPDVLDPTTGTFALGLEYDPDGDGPAGFQTMQVCLDPVFDSSGFVTSATLPGLPEEETWCWAGAISTATGSSGEIKTVHQVYGEEDPIFRVK